MFDTFLFDFDGTIFDTGDGVTKSAQYALKKQGIDAEPASLRFFVGPPLLESFMVGCGLDHDAAMQAINDFRERYNPIGVYESHVYEGMPQLLEELKAAGKTIGIATSKPIDHAINLLERAGIRQYFDAVCGAPMGAPGIDKVDTIKNALRKLNSPDLESTLMIGDTKYDVAGAHEIGLKVVGVKYGYAAAGELEKAGADYIVETVEELKSFIL